MEYYKYCRAICCIIFGALGLVQISFAGVKPNFNDPAVQAAIALQYQQTAGKLTWMLTGGSSAGYDQRFPTAAISKPLGAVNSIGNWELFLDSAGKPATRTKADFSFPPFKEEVSDVSAKFKVRDVASAVGRFANKVITPLALGSALYDLARELGFWVSRNPDGSVKVERDGTSQECTINQRGLVFPSCDDAMVDYLGSNTGAKYPTGVFDCSMASPSYLACKYESWTSSDKTTKDPVLSTAPITLWGNPISTRKPSTQQEFEDAIANKPSWSPTSKLIPALNDALKSGEQVKPDSTTITTTGPASSPAPAPKVVDSPDAIATTTTSNSYNYAGDTITNTITNTTNNYSKVNNTTTTTTTTNNPDPLPFKDPCEDHPDRVACMNADTPTVDIPKKEKNVTYAAENLFGGGSCPAPKTATYFGQQLTFSFQPTCDALQNYIRYMIIAAALFSAYLMIVKSLKG